MTTIKNNDDKKSDRFSSQVRQSHADAFFLSDSPNCHPKLHLLAVERTGWRRYIFGRWVYPSEPFRIDIQRRNKQTKMLLKPWERICDPED